jgi:hypothetical protein
MATPERPVVDAAFNQRPILTRMVVVAAGLLLLGLVALVVWLLQQERSGPGEDGVEVVSAPTGVTAAAPEPGKVLLSWDAALGVDSYKVLQTRPTVLEQDVTALVDPDDPARYLVRLGVESADQYCYQLQALRESGAESPASTPEACTATTLPPEATPEPSPTAIVPLPAEEGETPAPGGAGTPSPTPSTPTPSPTTSPETPQPFISALKSYVGDATEPPPSAVTDRDALVAAGVQAKLLHTGAWTITPPFNAPVWLLYVDAPAAGDLAGACEAIVAQHASVVPNMDCALAAPRQVAPSTSSPDASPAL